MNAKEVIFETRDLHYAYLGKFPALCGVDMRIRQGEKIAIIGANGSGKSSLLKILDGLIFPDRGDIFAFGTRLHEDVFCDEDFSQAFRSRVGFVFQDPDVQLFCPTVREDIAFGPLQLGVAPDEIKRRIGELVRDFGIEELLDRSPYQLSVGEKRKVAIASTLAVAPRVLILDEPTAGLDPATMRHIVDIITKAHEEGKTVVTATHDMHIVQEIADTIYCFGHDKKIARYGPAQEILEDRQFLEAHNLVHTHRHRHPDSVHTHPHDHAEHHH